LNIHHASFVTPVVLGGKGCLALVDTGASVSCVHPDFVGKSSLRSSAYRSLCGAGKDRLTVLGMLDCDLVLQGRQFRHEFFVIQNLIQPAIIGLDFLSNQSIHLNCRDREVVFQGESPRLVSSLIAANRQEPPQPQPLASSAIYAPPSTTTAPLPFSTRQGRLQQGDLSSHPIREETTVNYRPTAPTEGSPQVNAVAYGGWLPDSLRQSLMDHPESSTFAAGSARATPVQIKLNSPDVRPIRQNLRAKARREKEIIDREVQSMLESGVIRESRSPWSSPIQIVKKKDGSNRFCIDFRLVNKLVVGDAYPTPRVSDIIHSLGKSSVFSTIDLVKGNWQIPLAEESKPITAFSTADGLFEFNVLPFGISIASAAFNASPHPP